jgi:hypothetical protein
MKALVVLACVLFAANAYAGCSVGANGQTVCNNGQQAGGYNPNTGNSFHSQRNSNGVATTTTSRGGEAKTMNGKGVVHGPNGKTCAKTAHNEGCN